MNSEDKIPTSCFSFLKKALYFGFGEWILTVIQIELQSRRFKSSLSFIIYELSKTLSLGIMFVRSRFDQWKELARSFVNL